MYFVVSKDVAALPSLLSPTLCFMMPSINSVAHMSCTLTTAMGDSGNQAAYSCMGCRQRTDWHRIIMSSVLQPANCQHLAPASEAVLLYVLPCKAAARA